MKFFCYVALHTILLLSLCYVQIAPQTFYSKLPNNNTMY
jgi:hypothetical protein